MVYANQQAYYDAITASTNAGQSGPFIDFMLNEILRTLKAHQGEPLSDKVPSEVPNQVPNQFPNQVPNETAQPYAQPYVTPTYISNSQ